MEKHPHPIADSLPLLQVEEHEEARAGDEEGRHHQDERKAEQAMKPLIAGAIGFSVGVFTSLIVFFIFLFTLLPGCAGHRLPTRGENKDYCHGQLLLCVQSNCDAWAAPAPHDPCRLQCQAEYDNCMRCPTRDEP